MSRYTYILDNCRTIKVDLTLNDATLVIHYFNYSALYNEKSYKSNEWEQFLQIFLSISYLIVIMKMLFRIYLFVAFEKAYESASEMLIFFLTWYIVAMEPRIIWIFGTDEKFEIATRTSISNYFELFR